MPPPDALAAALADRYRLEREIGAGGMATVYLARDLRHGRDVAVKVFRSEVAQTLGSDRFLREIQIAAQLHHPHILSLHDSGEAAGCLYYLMPFVDGETLRARLRRDGPLAIDAALHIAREVADALGYAHRRGVVHRDVKPENILLADGHAFVADFGIARAMDNASSSLTQTGFALGTPAYMAPEQALGEREVDGRADLYALGCMLHEMLTGSPPYAGATQQAVLVKRFTEPVPLVRAVRPDVPAWLEQLVVAMLSRDPDGRPADAAEAQAHLSGAASVVDVRTRAPEPQPSIAVLPFANISADPDTEYFSDGISDELITALTRVRGLTVIARTSSFAFKGRQLDVRDVGRTLGVRHVLEGSVRSSGGRLRVSAQLIDAGTGAHVWTQRYDRALADVFAIQDEITEAISSAVGGLLVGPRRAGTYSTDEHTYDLFLRGRALLHLSSARYAEAQALLEEACARDSRFVPAHVTLADAHLFRIWWQVTPARAGWATVRSMAQHVLRLDPGALESERLLAAVEAGADHDFGTATQRLRRVIAGNPNDGLAHAMIAMFLLAQGHRDEAIPHNRRSLALDPLSPVNLVIASNFWSIAGFHSEATSVASLAVELAPQYPEGYHMRGLVHVYTGAHHEANIDLLRVPSLGNPSAWPIAKRCVALAGLGELGEVRRLLDGILARRAGEFMTPDAIACIYACLGDDDEAFRWLEVAAEEQAFWLSYLGVEPLFAPLRKDPRFEPFCRRWRIPVQALPATALDGWMPAARVLPSIAVLPFANMSADPDAEYFSDGITDELITALARVRGLKVIARTSAFALKGRQLDVRDVGKTLGVRHVLEGSVRQSGQRLRITAQLINATDGTPVWSERFDRNLDDVFAIQDEITATICRSIGHQILGGAPRAHVTDAETYALYLRGLYCVAREATRSSEAVALLQAAIRKDPSFVPAYTQLAYACIGQIAYALSERRTALAIGIAAAEKAVELDPQSADAHAALYRVSGLVTNSWADDGPHLQRARELGSTRVHEQLMWLHARRGEFDAAMESARASVACDPINPAFLDHAALLYCITRRHDDAKATARAALTLDPAYWIAARWLGWAHLYTGEVNDALHVLENAVSQSGRNVWPLSALAAALAVAGRRDEARTIANELAERRRQGEPILAFSMVVATMLLDRDEAFRWAETSVRDSDFWCPMFGSDPEFDPMHEDPRFVELSRRIGNPVLPPSVRAHRWWRTGSLTPGVAVESAPTPPSLVVLPFTNTSPDPDTDYFADGLTEEVIADLSNVRALKVIARNSAMRLKGTDKDVRTLGRDLGVSHVLAGSVRRAGDQLRITAQLARTEDERQLWAGKFSGTVADVFDLQERLAREIVGALSMQLTPEETTRLQHDHRPDVAVRDCYQRVRFDTYTFTADANARALRTARAGLAELGEHELLLVALGHATLNQMFVGSAPESQALGEAQECVDRIRRRWPSSTRADLLEGMIAYRRGDAIRCVTVLARVLAENPVDVEALMYIAIGYFLAGRFDEARRFTERAVSLDPVDPIAWNLTAAMHLYDGRMDEAIARFRKAAALEQESTLCRGCLVYALLSDGRDAEAREGAMALATAAPGDGVARVVLALVNAQDDGQSSLATLTDDLLDIARGDEMMSLYVAATYAHAGDALQAIAWLEHMVRVRGFAPARYLEELAPFTRPLRDHPRFQALLGEMRDKRLAFDRAHPPRT